MGTNELIYKMEKEFQMKTNPWFPGVKGGGKG